MATALPQTSGLIARWSADDIPTQADNSALASWVDSVGGFDAAQSTGVRQPKYRTNRVGGKPSVQFAGGQFLDAGHPAAIANALNAQISSVFIVFKTLNASSYGAMILFSKWFVYADLTSVGRFGATTNLGGTIPYSGQTAFSTFGGTAVVPDNTGGGTGQQRYFVNGGSATMNNLALPVDEGGNEYIGGDPGINFMFDGELFEVLMWNVELTPTEMLQAQMWACDKYSQAYPWADLNVFTVFDGDSITGGSGTTAMSESYPYKVAQRLGLNYGQWSNLGTGSANMPLLSTLAPTRIDNIEPLIGKQVALATFEWYNQRAASPTPENASVAYIAARRTARTKIAFGTSTDTSNPVGDVDRQAYNTFFDSHDGPTMDAYVPIHQNQFIGVETAYTTFPANFSDGVHLSDAGYTVLAQIMGDGLLGINWPSQQLQPWSDGNVSTWLPSTAGATLTSMIDEPSRDDADFAYNSGTVAGNMTVALRPGRDPLGNQSQWMQYAIAGNGAANMTVTLQQGANAVATWTHAPAPTSITTFSQLLTANQAGQITDYTALNLTIGATP